MHTGQLGEPYNPGQTALEERVTYRLDYDGHGLVIVKAGITAQEIENIASGAAELGMYVDGPIIFLLFKFGTARWNDAPYSWHTVPRGVRVYPDEARESGALLVTLVEAGDGLVKAVRKVVFTEEFAAKLNEAITNQANGSFNGLSYGKHINAVYNEYTAEDMAEMLNAHMSECPQ